MKRLLRIFELSKNEQRVVLIILLILITIAFIGYERRIRCSAVQPATATQTTPSATAVQAEEHH